MEKFSLGKIRSTLITAVVSVICLRIILWAVIPLLPYIIVGIVLVTVLGVALFRNNHF